MKNLILSQITAYHVILKELKKVLEKLRKRGENMETSKDNRLSNYRNFIIININQLENIIMISVKDYLEKMYNPINAFLI